MSEGNLHDRPKAREDLLVKISLPVHIWGGDVPETVWAARLMSGYLVLKNIPFYAYGISYDDVVRVEQNEHLAEAVEAVGRSGHSTYRFFVKEGNLERALANYWKVIEDAGCTYERATRHLFSIDVPPKTDIHAVYQALEKGETAGVWEFEEGHCGHPV